MKKNKKIFIIAGIILAVAIIGVVCFLVFNNNMVTISFNENGGDGVTNIKVKKGEVVTLPEISKEGYSFDGWYVDDKKVEEKTSFDKDTLLIAKWTEYVKEFIVTFDSNGGTEISSITLRDGETLTLPEPPTKSGYKFVSWVDNNSMPIYTGALLEARDITLYAIWEESK